MQTIKIRRVKASAVKNQTASFFGFCMYHLIDVLGTGAAAEPGGGGPAGEEKENYEERLGAGQLPDRQAGGRGPGGES